eukprot:TRINITY_DN7943_c0_g1_i1.p1 TRINITY_DN7943_c0_g1~~TRINITY_DN7943_c0_g1_i1.p1  ORF type:complete len:730 (+),score=149.42 TRINITY_DN7943_c0_g1_i1:32-2191(+)
MVMHPQRDAMPASPGSAPDTKKSKKKTFKPLAPKQEPESQPSMPMTPGLLTPSSAPVTPGLLTPYSPTVVSPVSPGAAGYTSPAVASRTSQGSKVIAGREQKQEGALTRAATPTLSLDSLVTSDAKSVAHPLGVLPGLDSYNLAAQKNSQWPSCTFPASQNIEVSASSVPDPGLATDDDGSDIDMTKLAMRLMGMLDDDDILYVAQELQSLGYMQEFTLDLPTPQGQQLPSMMLQRSPFGGQQIFQQNQQVFDLQQMLSGGSGLDLPQNSQLRVDPTFWEPQPESASQSSKTSAVQSSFVQQMQNSKKVLQKVTSSGTRSPELQSANVLEKQESAPGLSSPSLCLEEQAECIQEDEHSQADEAASSKTRHDKSNITSLLIQNLPNSFSQQATRAWVDSHGYRDLYDMLMWFPAKQSSTQMESRAFINFRDAYQAKRFRREFHNTWIIVPLNQGNSKVSITTAKQQGFTANFIRFWHLSQKSYKEAKESSQTVCPFFARDMVATVSADEKKQAEAMGASPQPAPQKTKPVVSKPVVTKGNAEWVSTTLAIRNLPEEINTQNKAMKWLVRHGHKNFDFLLFVPRKQNCKVRNAATPGGLAYMFVNFCSANKAHVCAQALHNSHVGEGAPNLSVVAAKLQGFQACEEHFKELAKSGRLVPWSDPEKGKSKGCKKADAGEEWQEEEEEQEDEEEDEPKAEGVKTMPSDARNEQCSTGSRQVFQ